MNNKRFFLPVILVLVIVLLVVAGYTLNDSATEVTTSSHSIQVNEEANFPSYLYVTIALLSLSTLFAVSISFYLYRWRRILLSEPNSTVPEEWAKYLKSVGEGLSVLSGTMENNVARISHEASDNSRRISSMTDTYMELQSALDEKDREISRLKQGYDADIYRKFVARFARIDQTVDDLINDHGDTDGYDLLKRLFENAFDECGVEKYAPNIGEDYRSATGVSDNPKVQVTDDPSLEFQISEIIEAGYMMKAGETTKTIIPSKVRIYTLEGNVQ